jgi:hypothetical protein
MMNRFIYIGVFAVSVLVLAVGVLFLCAATTIPERLPLAIILLILGAGGAGWSAYAYRRWASVQPGELAARITDLAAENDGELALSQIMSAFDVPASVATAALDGLAQKGQCHREVRGEQNLYIFPGLKEHKVVRKCVYCGSTFPVKQSLQKCPNCGGNLELVKV